MITILVAPWITIPSAWSTEAVPTPKKMDLRIPALTELYTAAQIHHLLANIPTDIEAVEVEGSRGTVPQSTPHVWRGAFAPIWAVFNPTQAWRIFAPLPPDQTRATDEPFDATSGYLKPAAPMPGH